MQHSESARSRSYLFFNGWLSRTIAISLAAVVVALIPWMPLSTLGALALLSLLPGAQMARWLGLWQSWRSLPGLLTGAGLGLVVSPLLLFWAGWLFGFSRLETFAVCLLFIWLLAWLNSRFPAPGHLPPADLSPPETDIAPAARQKQAYLNRAARSWWLIATLVGLAAVIVLAYTEGRTELGSYPIQMGDWVKHHGVTWSLRRTGLPPANVFFAGMAPDEKLSYYYFFHLTAASLDIMRGGASNVHASFVTAAVLASVCLAGLVYLLAVRLFQDRRAGAGALLFATFIGGLDIIPILRRARLKEPDASISALFLTAREHIDNWAPTQQLRLSTFMAHYLWTPQHVAGLLIVTLGLYLYQAAPGKRRLLPVLALLAAALLGHSTWIALVAFPALALFALYEVGLAWRVQGEQAAGRLAGGYLLFGAGAVMAALPFALSLLNTGTTQAGLVFEIPRNLSDWPLLSPFSTRFPNSDAARLLDVPIHYFVEMGALLVGGLLGWRLFWRQHRREPLLPLLSLLIVIGFGAITFFAAGRNYADLGLILNNDLGLRAIMPAQLALALFAGYYLARITRSGRWQLLVLGPLIVLGWLPRPGR